MSLLRESELREQLRRLIARDRETADIWERQAAEYWPTVPAEDVQRPPERGRKGIKNWINWLRKRADELDAALAGSVLPEGGWQDISTAPKDGTMILVVEPKNLQRRLVIWVQQWGWMSVPGRIIVRPTHWQPIPDFPPLREGGTDQ